MNVVRRIIGWLKPRPETPEELLDTEDAVRRHDEMTDIRLSTRSGSAAENYQTGRGSRLSR
jgi:hypothetical protein